MHIHVSEMEQNEEKYSKVIVQVNHHRHIHTPHVILFWCWKRNETKRNIYIHRLSLFFLLLLLSAFVWLNFARLYYSLFFLFASYVIRQPYCWQRVPKLKQAALSKQTKSDSIFKLKFQFYSTITTKNR